MEEHFKSRLDMRVFKWLGHNEGMNVNCMTRKVLMVEVSIVDGGCEVVLDLAEEFCA